MTIKEVEMLSGMERANIRFYESEGLIAPRRMHNGYRDYAEEDLQLLLRIKLLRSLHISLEEIKSLKAGNSDLSQALSRQIQKLEREKQDVSYAQEVCRAIKSEEADFANLDAAKYLGGIRQAAGGTETPYFTLQGDVLPQVFHPWRRYLARTLDIFIYGMVWSAALAFVFHVRLAARSTPGSLLDSVVALVIMLFAEPLWLHLFGTTPGKAVFGLRIEDADGKRLSYSQGLERTWGVIGAGMGYYIPVYQLVRLWKSYDLCKRKERQPWDAETSYFIQDTRWFRGVLYIGAYAAAFGVLLVMQSAQWLPPNRGELTVAQFAKNYNYYAALLEAEPRNIYLTEAGEWAEKDPGGTIYLEIGYSEKPVFRFDLENGYIKSVSFEINPPGEEDVISSHDTYMMLSSLAVTCAQSEVGLFSKARVRIAKQIEASPFQSFRFTEAGVTLACDTAYEGYRDSHMGLLWRKEDATRTSYTLAFSISK